MQPVNYITCVNTGAFLMKFSVKWLPAPGQPPEQSEYTDTYPVLESRTIDLDNLRIPNGAEVWPVVHASLGETTECSEHVTYDLYAGINAQTATYKVGGTVDDIDCNLQGG